MSIDFDSCLASLPLVAILRGITPEQAGEVGDVLVEAGFSIIEVPMNSPRPFESIEILARRLGDRALIGAGTVLDAADIAPLAHAGGKLVVMPHSDLTVVRAAVAAGLTCMPGVATATEAFAALAAGAAGVKLFPADALGVQTLAAWRSVFPKTARFFPVGGINPDNLGPWIKAGATGFGLGSALYKAGMSTRQVEGNARAFAAAWQAHAA